MKLYEIICKQNMYTVDEFTFVSLIDNSKFPKYFTNKDKVIKLAEEYQAVQLKLHPELAEKKEEPKEDRWDYSVGWNGFGFKIVNDLIDRLRNQYDWSDSDLADLIINLGCKSYIRDENIIKSLESNNQ